MGQPVVWWVVAGVASVVALAAILWAARAGTRARADRRRAREAVLGELGRVPLREPQAREPMARLDEFAAFASQGPREPPAAWTGADLDALLTPSAAEVPGARTVETPDGRMTLTPPPFRLRGSVMTQREREYAKALASMLPSGYVVCPQVRLDALLTPVAPKDRPIDDWRNWRRRVRLRAVDFVVCRLPGWEPVIALEIEPAQRTVKAFQRDRIIDETLMEVGLPIVRCSGDPEEDWAMIEPYVREAEAEPMPPPRPGGNG